MSVRALAAFVFFFSALLNSQTVPTLSTEMDRLHVDTVLVFHSSAIDDTPVWSPDSRFLAANVMGKWFSADLSHLRLEEANWHESRIGVTSDPKSFPPADEAEVSKWLTARPAKQEVVSASGVVIKLQRKELSTMLVLSKGSEDKTLWRTDLENCGALSGSPDGKFVAYICDTNGVLVVKVDAAYARASR